jgi:hypothetical protein
MAMVAIRASYDDSITNVSSTTDHAWGHTSTSVA